MPVLSSGFGICELSLGLYPFNWSLSEIRLGACSVSPNSLIKPAEAPLSVLACLSAVTPVERGSWLPLWSVDNTSVFPDILAIASVTVLAKAILFFWLSGNLALSPLFTCSLW